MKILISHVFSEDNKGDAALLSILVADVRSVFGSSVDMTILTIDNVPIPHTFEGVPVLHSFMYHALNKSNRIFKLLNSFSVMYSTLLWARIYKKTGKEIPLPKRLQSLATLYKDTDMIIGVGGGYLRGKKGFSSGVLLMLLLHSFRVAKILGKPTIIYPQSVGPFGNSFQEWLAKNTLRNVNLIMVRENISYQLLRRLGVTENVVRTIDSGFLFESKNKMDLHATFNIPRDQMIVGMTVRNWLKTKDQTAYEKEMAKFIDHITGKYHAKIILIPQVTAQYHKDDDRVISKRVYERVRNQDKVLLLEENYSHYDVKAIYSDLDYMVGTRFHSVIFALTAYVPCIGIEYEHKTSGILHDLGLDEWWIKIEDVTAEKLIRLFDKLVVERDSYKKHLTEVLPAYIERAKEAPVLIREVYDSVLQSQG